MELKIRNGDYVALENGGMEMVEGSAELIQRVRYRLTARREGSVSYTHLDVYKRQEYDKLIDRQLQRAAITSVSGFAKLYQDASRVLTLQ